MTASLRSLPSGMGSANRESWQEKGEVGVPIPGSITAWLSQAAYVPDEGGPFYVTLRQALLALCTVAFPVVSQHPAFILVNCSLLSLSGDSLFGCGICFLLRP